MMQHLFPFLFIVATISNSHAQNNVAMSPPYIRPRFRIGALGYSVPNPPPKQGLQYGPAFIRASGLMQELSEDGHDVVDYGDVSLAPGVTGVPTAAQISEAANRLSSQTHIITSEGRIPFTFGEHTAAIGAIDAVTKVLGPNVGLLWINSHPALRTPSDPRNFAELSLLIQELRPEMMQMLPQFSWISPGIPASNVVLMGADSVKLVEAEKIKALGITAYTMRDVERFGISQVTRAALSTIGPKPVFIAFDIDVLYAWELELINNPAVSTDNFSVGQILTLFEEIIMKGQPIAGVGLYNVDPTTINPNHIAMVQTMLKDVITCAFGNCRGGLL